VLSGMRSWLPWNGPRHEHPGRGFLCAAVVLYPLLAHVDLGANDGTTLAPVYAQQVDRRLNIPESQQRAYAELLAKNLASEDGAQYVVIVDRNKFVQAAMIYWMARDRVVPKPPLGKRGAGTTARCQCDRQSSGS
jgi:hypothetical protein